MGHAVACARSCHEVSVYLSQKYESTQLISSDNSQSLADTQQLSKNRTNFRDHASWHLHIIGFTSIPSPSSSAAHRAEHGRLHVTCPPPPLADHSDG